VGRDREVTAVELLIRLGGWERLMVGGVGNAPERVWMESWESLEGLESRAEGGAASRKGALALARGRGYFNRCP